MPLLGKFKFKNKLYSLDATVVSLCLSLFPWASFRRTKGGIKLHTLVLTSIFEYIICKLQKKPNPPRDRIDQ